MVFPFTPEKHRRYGVVLRAITGIIAVLATIFLAWFGIGTQLFHSLVFWSILVLWLLFGWFSFLNAWDRAGDSSAEERVEGKMDDILASINRLADEIRRDRDERNKV